MNDGELMDRLDVGRRRALGNVRDAAGRIWARPLHRYYTDHSVAHSERIIALLDGLTAGVMESDKRLSQTEVFCLLAAAYLHDIGMQNERFAGGDLDEIRAHHHEQTAEMIYAVFEDPASAVRIPLGDEPGIVEGVALVARGHRRVDLTAAEYEPLTHGGGRVRVRLLAALLRFADELDIDHRRVDLEQMKVLALPVASQLHWWKCHYVGGVVIADGYIRAGYRLPQGRPDYEELVVPLVETGIRAKLAELEEIFWASGVKVALGKPEVRPMRLVQPLPPEVEALARRELAALGRTMASPPPPAGAGRPPGGKAAAPARAAGRRRPAAGGTVYNIHIEQASGLAIGDGARVEQSLAPAPAGRGDWEAVIAQVTSRLDALSAQLGRGVGDLKRGQAALYRRVDGAYRGDLARVLEAVQQGRLEQGEMQGTLDALRRAMRAAMERGLPMDAELRRAVADLSEAVESRLDLARKLELSLPLLPLLTYKIELGVGSTVDLHDLWDELRRRWERLVGRFGG